jgi:hypothetical protein
VTQDDLLYRFRPRVFAIAAELGTVRAACRAMEIHPSRSGPVATSSPPPVGAAAGRAFGRALGCRLPRQPARRACASTTFATRLWRCGSPPARRPRRWPCARGTSVSFTLDRYGHQTIPWVVAGGRCHPVRD